MTKQSLFFSSTDNDWRNWKMMLLFVKKQRGGLIKCNLALDLCPLLLQRLLILQAIGILTSTMVCHSVYWLKKGVWYHWPWDPSVKIGLYGFKGASLKLYRNYLSDRTQVTVINNVNSETSFINCGVPQGSILGPLQFLLYINDLPNCNLLSDVGMYADDTNFTFASKDSEELFSSLTNDLGNLKQWLDSNF